MKSVKLNQQQWITKHTSGIYGVGTIMMKWKPWRTPACPRYGLGEHMQHMSGYARMKIQQKYWRNPLAHSKNEWVIAEFIAERLHRSHITEPKVHIAHNWKSARSTHRTTNPKQNTLDNKSVERRKYRSTTLSNQDRGLLIEILESLLSRDLEYQTICVHRVFTAHERPTGMWCPQQELIMNWLHRW